MARQSGKAGKVILDNSGTAIVYHVARWEANYKGDAIDVTGMNDSGLKNFVGGLTEFTATVECFADPSNELDSDITPAGTCYFELYHNVSDTKCWHGDGIITDKNPQVQVDGAVRWSIALTGTGLVQWDTPV